MIKKNYCLFQIWYYHLKGLLLSFQKIIKSLNLDHQRSSYRADSSTSKMKGIELCLYPINTTPLCITYHCVIVVP